MTTKRIYPTNKIIVKDPKEIKNYDYINPTAQQIFNFILAEMIKNQSNIIDLKISDFFAGLTKNILKVMIIEILKNKLKF